MPKKPIIIANWKMNLGVKESLDLAKEVIKQCNNPSTPLGVSDNIAIEQLEIVLCPSFTALASMSSIRHPTFAKASVGRQASSIKLGAQDVFWEERGSFTGEVSPLTLKELGCEYVIIGHSERRQYLGETDEMVHKKVKVTLDTGLIPVLCVGENFDERQKGQKEYVIMSQISKALEGLDLEEKDELIIAYEPVWVIGSGQAIEPEEAEYTNKMIKAHLLDVCSEGFIGSNLRVIYGGSVDKENVAEFVKEQTVDGVLVGGASLKIDEFLGLIEAVVEIHE